MGNRLRLHMHIYDIHIDVCSQSGMVLWTSLLPLRHVRRKFINWVPCVGRKSGRCSSMPENRRRMKSGVEPGSVWHLALSHCRSEGGSGVKPWSVWNLALSHCRSERGSGVKPRSVWNLALSHCRSERGSGPHSVKTHPAFALGALRRRRGDIQHLADSCDAFALETMQS